MRISRKKRPQKPLIPRYNKNEWIKAPEVLVLDEEGQNIGVMETKKALSLAGEKELDLVEINPKTNPPVCKLIDFNDFKYQKEKEAKKQKQKSKTSEVKGVRLSVRIGKHDMDVKKGQALKFLNRGDKVKIEIILRGRENARPEIARDVISQFVNLIREDLPVKFEQNTARQGRKFIATIVKE